MRIASGLLLLAFLPGIGAHAADGWTRARTEHFVLVGNARAEVTEVAARELERFHAAVEAATPLRFGPEARTVYVFKNARSFRRAAGTVPDAHNLEGLTVDDESGTVLLAIADSPRGGLERIRHELVHALLETKAVPLWLGEGMAQYLSFLETAGDEVVLGLPGLALGEIDDCAWVPLASLVRLEAYPRSDTETCAFYLGSALLLQHLAEREDGLPGLFAFVDRIAGGASAEAALRAQYGIDLARPGRKRRARARACASRCRCPRPRSAWRWIACRRSRDCCCRRTSSLPSTTTPVPPAPTARSCAATPTTCPR
jgi:hypothetical protein